MSRVLCTYKLRRVKTKIKREKIYVCMTCESDREVYQRIDNDVRTNQIRGFTVGHKSAQWVSLKKYLKL